MRKLFFLLLMIPCLAFAQGLGVLQQDRMIHTVPQVFNDTIWARGGEISFGNSAGVRMYLLGTGIAFEADSVLLPGGLSSQFSADNRFEYRNGAFIIWTDQRDAKMLQGRNELNDIGIWNLFIDANGHGGFSVDQYDGTSINKLRGDPNGHSYSNANRFSFGRSGESIENGGTVDGARVTISGTRNPYLGLGSAENYQLMVQSPSDVNGSGAGIAFTNESATKDINVGSAIVYKKLGNNGAGQLEFYTKSSTTDLVVPDLNMTMGMGFSELSSRVEIDKNSADSQAAITVKQSHASATGAIASFENSGGEVASVTEEGYLRAQAPESTSEQFAVWQGDTLGIGAITITSETYAPIITDSLNVQNASLLNAYYTVVGDVVTVNLAINFRRTAAGICIAEIPLPVASDIESEYDVFGTGAMVNSTSLISHGLASIRGNVGDDTAYLYISPNTGGIHPLYISFSYVIK
jgi:hypothetical protein